MQMKINFGKHSGKSLEILILKDPSYIKWILAQTSPKGEMAVIKTHAKKLIAIFDAKPITNKNCWAFRECHNKATKLTVYRDNIDPYWWCDTCDPYQTGANPGKLQSPVHYVSALEHVEAFCSDKKSSHSKIIKTIARAKGLPMRVGEAQAQKFFYP